MKTTFIPYSKQLIEADDVHAVLETLASDYLTTGPQVAAFEKEIASYCGAHFAVVCSNGTAALHMACLALGLRSGDAIITSPITFLATANCARFVGADVLFSDIDPTTANLDPIELSKTLSDAKRSKNVKAVFPVHFAGQPADMEGIAETAHSHGIKIVEDASHALGAEYQAKNGDWIKSGSCRHSDMTVFSFHPVKHITTGEGGAITTNDEGLYQRLLLFRNHGMVRDTASPWYYEMTELGFNYRLTDIQCALGRSQLKKMPDFLKRRRQIAEEYQRFLSTAFGNLVKPLEVPPHRRHAYHLFPVRIDFKKAGVSRALVMQSLKGKGVGTQVHYIPVHLQPYYRRHGQTRAGDFPLAENYYEQALSLPMYVSMPCDGVERVIKALDSVLSGKA